ncbi:phosphotransferase family protein [Paenibacillus sp. MMO-177]|uniref:phosphotransferase family protein n=1 Tax=Paenibacillus sp. MMO-177 TaxID=3081289 RepID=UPI00301A9E93
MHLLIQDLENYLNRAVLAERKVKTVNRLHGGAQKAVYKVSCDDGFTCILYVWDPSENFILRDDTIESRLKTLGASFGAELFEYNHKYMSQLGVSLPNVLCVDRTKSSYPFDFAIVEDVGNMDLPNYILNYPESKKEVLEKLNDMLIKMHTHTTGSYGQLNKAADIVNQSSTLEEVVLDHSLQDLEYLSENVASIRKNKDRLTEVLYSLYDAVPPRKEYGLIHGELGPDHVFVRSNGEPVLIDIEGVKFFDIEYEHSFMEFRFLDDYNNLRNDNLDAHRLRFYKLHLHMSYASGPLRVIQQGDFPNIAFMRDIADYNLKSTLRFLRE